MPSDSRETKRRNFSISMEASHAIDKFASEHDMTKSKVVERAVLEYTGEDATARIEEKVDEILAKVDGNEGRTPSPSESAGEKKNFQRQSDFSPSDYDPDEERDDMLTKENLKQLVELEEPIINPEHFYNSHIPGGTQEKTDIVAGVARYKASQDGTSFVYSGVLTQAIESVVGTSDYIMETYKEKAVRQFTEVIEVRFDSDEHQYSVERDKSKFFSTESDREEYYQERYEKIQKAVNTPIHEVPDFGKYYVQTYEEIRQWLDNWRVRNSLTELDVASEEEIDELEQHLIERRTEVESCLDAIIEVETTGNYTRKEAIEALPYSEEKSEKVFDFLDEVDYVGEWDASYKDWGIAKANITWR